MRLRMAVVLAVSLCVCLCASAQTAIRVNAGGGSYTDSLGRAWQADTGFVGGGPESYATAVSGTADQALFKDYRWNPTSYGFSVPNGTYQVNLYFTENAPQAQFAGARVFSVTMQGATVISSLDIYKTAGGNAALIKTVNVAVANGKLTIGFVPVSGLMPKVSAIEIVSAGAPPDTSAPTVAITAPATGATLSGVMTVTASASDNVGVMGVQLQVDGANSGAEDMAAPYTMALDTTTLSNGSHSLTAVARDAAGNRTTSAPVAVNVANTTGTSGLTTLRVNSGGAAYTDKLGQVWQADTGFNGGNAESYPTTISGTLDSALFQDYRWDPASYSFSVTPGQYQVSLLFTENNPQAQFAGSRVFTVTMQGAATFSKLDVFALVGGNAALIKTATVSAPNGTLAIGFTPVSGLMPKVSAIQIVPAGSITPDTTPPTVSISSPANGATVSGTVAVSANASDNVGIASVQFRLDGANIGALDTASPYTTSWNTTTASNGTHTLSAIATDTSNNRTTSATLTVQVNNSSTPPTGTVALPLKASANGHYLVDQNNVPFLLMGDASHSLIGAIGTTDIATYMTTRAAQGFNAIQVFAPCDTYEVNCPASMASFSGVVPFTSGSSQSDYDLSTPNPAYWSLVDNVLSMAAARNLVVFLNPMETGGLLGLLEHNGTTKVFNYGVFLGNRYKNTPNLVWDFGNDFQNWRSSPGDNNLIAQLMAGIASVDPNHLIDIELDYDRSFSNQDTGLAPSVSFDAAYTYYQTYDCVLAAYNSSPTMPVFMIEANYEDENNTGFYSGNTGAFVLRLQEYWTMTSGATGQFYGAHSTNHFLTGWQTNMNTSGALEIVFLTQLFRSLPWWNLVPDQTHQIVTAGFGTYNGSDGNLPVANYSTTVWVPDGSLAIVYDPAGNALTVNLAMFSGPVTARWYDPSNGTYTSIAGSPFANSGSHVFSTPGKNHDADSDWVLVLQ